MRMLKLLVLAGSLMLASCGYFDDAKKLAEQVKTLQRLNSELESQLASLKKEMAALRQDNERLGNELAKYGAAHERMMQ